MMDAQYGYYGVTTLYRYGHSDTMIATKCPLWTDDEARVVFKRLFVDQDGDYLQDEAEDLMSEEDLPLDDYELNVNIIWFCDINSNGIYDEGDGICSVTSSNAEMFSLTNEPVIWGICPDNSVFPREKIRLKGRNLGDGSGGSFVHIGTEALGIDSPRIKVWTDTKIKVKIPDYSCGWFDDKESRRRNVWVTVDDGDQLADSNKKKLKVMIPEDCP